MRQVVANDYDNDVDRLVQMMHEASAPLVLRHPVSPLTSSSWRLRDSAALLALHGDDPVDGGVYHAGGKRLDVSIPLRDFFPSLHNGSVPTDSYIFLDVSDMALARSTVALGDLYKRVSLRRDSGYAFALETAPGRPVLSAGGWGNGRPFHAHGPALNALVSGVKHWFVRRPHASARKMEVPEGLTRGAALPVGWEDALWQCTQRVGDLVWIPDMLEHATLNFDQEVSVAAERRSPRPRARPDRQRHPARSPAASQPSRAVCSAPRILQTVAIFHVINDLSDTPLHAAARAGDEAAVRALLRAGGGANLHGRSKKGATPLIYAAGHGHVATMKLLIDAGADVAAAANNGGQALHAAAAGGHTAAVELLLRHGAPAEARDGTGQSPHDLASRPGKEETARALVAAMSDEAVARLVAQDRALLSQPFIHEGVLLSAAASGRRIFLHSLSELPKSEAFTTRHGNRLERVDATTVALAGTTRLAVPPAAPPAMPWQPLPSVELVMQMPAALFSGPAAAREDATAQLLQHGTAANGAGDFRTAGGCFEAAYALSLRPGFLASAANMRLKIPQLNTAAAMYRAVLAAEGLHPEEREMATRKLGEAKARLKQQGADAPPAEPTASSVRADPVDVPAAAAGGAAAEPGTCTHQASDDADPGATSSDTG